MNFVFNIVKPLPSGDIVRKLIFIHSRSHMMKRNVDKVPTVWRHIVRW